MQVRKLRIYRKIEDILKNFKLALDKSLNMYYDIIEEIMWGFGEVGIALDWQSGDQGFESPKLHQIKRLGYYILVFFNAYFIYY